MVSFTAGTAAHAVKQASDKLWEIDPGNELLSRYEEITQGEINPETLTWLGFQENEVPKPHAWMAYAEKLQEELKRLADGN